MFYMRHFVGGSAIFIRIEEENFCTAAAYSHSVEGAIFYELGVNS